MRCSKSSTPRRRLAELRVRVTPKARQARIEFGDPVKVYVTAPPLDGQANEAVVRLVADRLGLAKSRVELIRGHQSRDKTLVVEGLSLEEIASRLAET